MNKLLLLWIAALILLIIIIFIPLPTILELAGKSSINSTLNSTVQNLTVGLIGIQNPIAFNSSINFKQVPSANYSLNDYNLIIISNQTYCDYGLRFALANWVRNGGRLILTGDSCTRVPDDPASIGWNVGVNSLGSVMPVVFGGVTTASLNSTQSPDLITIENGSIEIVDYSSFAFNNLSNFNFSGNMTIIYPSFSGKVLGLITFENNSQNQTENQSLYAVVKSSDYNVFYLSFDPSLEPQLTYNIIKGMTS